MSPSVGTFREVVVVGAGPAGALAARELARRGVDVLLLDRDEFPRWKVCGACLSPGAQEALRRCGLGALPGHLGAVHLESLHLSGWGRRARVPLMGTMAVSRGALDMALIDCAREEGVVFIPRARARWLGATKDGVGLQVDQPQGASKITASVVVAADGLRSGLLAGAGLRTGPKPGTGGAVGAGQGKVGLGAVIREVGTEYGPGVIHMVVGPQGYVGLVRTEEGLLTVAAAVDRYAMGKAESPAHLVNRVLAGAGAPPLEGEVLEGWRGTPALGYRPSRVGGPRILAVGDAAGFVEPFTGEGMGWALSGARALVPVVQRALGGWNEDIPGLWEEVYARTIAPAQRLSRLMAWTLGRPLPARVLLGALTRLPGVAGPFVRRAANPPSLHRIPEGSLI